MSKPLPYASKPGKKKKGGDSGSGGDKGGSSRSGSSPQPEGHMASCPDCGSLGMYFDAGDAKRAENQHQQNKHGNSAHKKTATVESQNKRNKGGGK
jgi:hypothetical protein